MRKTLSSRSESITSCSVPPWVRTFFRVPTRRPRPVESMNCTPSRSITRSVRSRSSTVDSSWRRASAVETSISPTTSTTVLGPISRLVTRMSTELLLARHSNRIVRSVPRPTGSRSSARRGVGGRRYGRHVTDRSLEGKVALVAGATRGAGRGIAVALGEAGATVYCTGRSSAVAGAGSEAHDRSLDDGSGHDRASDDRTGSDTGSDTAYDRSGYHDRSETIEETAARVTAAGGTGVPVRVDHSVPDEVAALVDRIADSHGRLDVLVNDVWGGENLIEWDV